MKILVTGAAGFIETLVREMGWILKSLEDVITPAENASVELEIDKQGKYSSRIMHLRSLRGNGITPKDIEDDERLAYLLKR